MERIFEKFKMQVFMSSAVNFLPSSSCNIFKLGTGNARMLILIELVMKRFVDLNLGLIKLLLLQQERRPSQR